MFEQSDYRVLPPGDGLAASLPARLGQATGAALVQVGPTMWSGRSMAKSWGITPTVLLNAAAAQGGTGVQITIGAELDTTGWVLFILAAVFFWPAAVLIGFLAYDDFNKRRQYALQVFWSQLGAPAAPSPYGVRPG